MLYLVYTDHTMSAKFSDKYFKSPNRKEDSLFYHEIIRKFILNNKPVNM